MARISDWIAAAAMTMMVGTLVSGQQQNAQGTAAAPQGACLHGATETVQQAERRLAALRFARRINTAESAAFGLTGPYKALNQLADLGPAPEGFRVQLRTDGSPYGFAVRDSPTEESGYSFSVKDTQDACGFTLFSDQMGTIYTASPLR